MIGLDKRVIAVIGGGIILAFVLGVIIGNVTAPGEEKVTDKVKDKFQDKELVRNTVESVRSDNLRQYLSILSAEPHIAASERDR